MVIVSQTNKMDFAMCHLIIYSYIFILFIYPSKYMCAHILLTI